METIIQNHVKLIYNKKNVTSDLAPYLISVSYDDNVTGEADEVNLVFDDTDKNWQNLWYPTKGDTLDVSIGYGSDLVNCGIFEIDEFELSKNPDTVTIKALAAGIKKKLRTRKSKAHENKVLSQIVKSVASEHGLKIIGNVKDISIDRKTQNNEGDMTFLNRIGKEYGYLFSVKNDNLVFYNKYDLELNKPICGISYNMLLSCTLRDKSIGTYKNAVVSYQDPDTGDNVEATVSTDDFKEEQETPSNSFYDETWLKRIPFKILPPDDTAIKYKLDIKESTSSDTLKVIKKAENKQQAESMAKSMLHDANSKQVEGSISLPGLQYFVAGTNFTLVDAGKFAGIYHIVKSSHHIDKSGGYITNGDIRRIKKLA